MKLSKLIKQLQAIYDKYGDITCVLRIGSVSGAFPKGNPVDRVWID